MLERRISYLHLKDSIKPALSNQARGLMKQEQASNARREERTGMEREKREERGRFTRSLLEKKMEGLNPKGSGALMSWWGSLRCPSPVT